MNKKNKTPYRELYKEMEKSGELYEVFSDMTGIWTEDKKNFIEQQEALESLGNTKEVYE